MKRILIVDDDTDVRESLTNILSKNGFSVEQAESGTTAIKLVTSSNYDLALLDFIMPDMDGIETLVALKKIRPTMKFIMITAFATIDNAVAAIKKGANDYIAKPFQVDNLTLVINRVLEEAKFEEEIRLGDLDQTLVALSNPIRRRIVELLSPGKSMRLTEMTKLLDIRDHTKVLFHLRSLKEAGILSQARNRAYILTNTGIDLLEGLKQLKTHMHYKK
jgi:DNA-binding response OmpR family regulator